MRDDYRHKLAISSINISHLPMLIPAQDVDMDGNYLSYYSPEINHIHNSFDTIIKPKYDNKYQTKNETNISDVIKYLNSVKLKINKKVFNFAINEWMKDDSVIFKGYNKLEVVNNNDSKEEKLRKISHNSKH